MFCSKCNHLVGENDTYCSYCGNSLVEARQAALNDSSTQNPVSTGNVSKEPPKAKLFKKDETFSERFYNADGRLNRKPYIIRFLILYTVAFCIGVIANLTGLDVTAGVVIKGILFVFVGIPSVMIMIRRLHDLNRTGWWWIFSVIPFINLFMLVYLLCFKGTVGPNRFGPDPLE